MKSKVAYIALLLLILTSYQLEAIADPDLNDEEPDSQFQQASKQDISIYLNLIPGVDFVPGEVIVVFNSDALSTGDETLDISSVPDDIVQFILSHGLYIKRVLPLNWSTMYLLGITNDRAVIEIVEDLSELVEITIACPNGILHKCDEPYWPNDPLWESNDDYDNDPKSYYDEQHAVAKIGADSVWAPPESVTGDGVIVAVIDDGVNWDHEDLVDTVWTNSDEIPGNDFDDDGNGYKDDIHGWDFNDGDGDISTPSFEQHGTNVSGVIAATQNNGKGISGIASGARIMGLKIANDEGELNVFVWIEAINYARLNGAHVINMSFATWVNWPGVEPTLNEAWNDGIVLTGSAGNDNQYNAWAYPANYGVVMCVGATAAFCYDNDVHERVPIDEQRWEQPCLIMSQGAPGSNYGPQLDVMGFGTYILTTDDYIPNNYHWVFGKTSAASPMVAAVAALCKSAFPWMSNSEIREAINRSCDDLDVPGRDDETGFGRINAIRLIYGPDRYKDEEDANWYVDLEPHDNQVIDSINNNPDNQGYPIYYRDPHDYYKITTEVHGKLIIKLDIYTWGENLDLFVYDNTELSPEHLVGKSIGDNHAVNSFEEVIALCEPDQTYYIRVSAAGSGDSSSYILNETVEANPNPCDPDDDAPDTSIVSGCYNRSEAVSSITIGVTGNDPLQCTPPSALTYEWQKRKSDEAWPPDTDWEFSSSNMIEVDGLTEWSWQIRVRAIDSAGNKDESPAICSFINGGGAPCNPDNDPPTTSIDSGCEDQDTPVTSIIIGVSGTDNCTDSPNLVYEWQKMVSGTGWPQTWEFSTSNMIQVDDLTQNHWSIRVRSVDEVGNKDGTPYICSFNNGVDDNCMLADDQPNDPCTGATLVLDGFEVTDCVDDGGDLEDWYTFHCPNGTDNLEIDVYRITGNPDIYLYTSCTDDPDDYIYSSTEPGASYEQIYVYEDLPYTDYYLKVVQGELPPGDPTPYSMYACNFISFVCRPPCNPDNDPPDTFIECDNDDKPCGTTSVILTVSGTDPDNCTLPQNLTFEWQIKEYWDSWPETWGESAGPDIEVQDLMTGTWDFRVRAVDEDDNKDDSAAECSFSILCPSPGDLNCSGCVDLQSGGWPGDALPIIQRWHEEEGQPGWDNMATMADCAGYNDGYIDANDIINIGVFWKDGC